MMISPLMAAKSVFGFMQRAVREGACTCYLWPSDQDCNKAVICRESRVITNLDCSGGAV